ncbi:hypothetical protein QU770_24020, partial [Escherichia coli]|nr:hypothetical protein [Escherichia coli]
MPPRTPKACSVRGCRHTTTDPSGYCESHKSEGWKQYKPGQSRHQRGYGSKWDVIRARVGIANCSDISKSQFYIIVGGISQGEIVKY